jgi:hypothetical protein
MEPEDLLLCLQQPTYELPHEQDESSEYVHTLFL